MRFLLVLLLALSGCVIGTWPTPEERSDDEQPGPGVPLAPEACNGLDDDADGSIDEGCPCSTDVRGCIAAEAGECGLGVQRCVGGAWASCGELGPPFVPARTPGLVVSATPATLVRDGPGLHVTVEVTTACEGIALPEVRVVLAAETPAMQVRALAQDDGAGPDATAGDGLYETELGNPFGPGVPAQVLELSAEARLSGSDAVSTIEVPLVEAEEGGR